jgi:hypothetical protein
MVLDEKENDITDEIVAFMGAKGDWCHVHYTPHFWNHNTLEFYIEGNEKPLVFKRHEHILF